jgi:hypothetical protein
MFLGNGCRTRFIQDAYNPPLMFLLPLSCFYSATSAFSAMVFHGRVLAEGLAEHVVEFGVAGVE